MATYSTNSSNVKFLCSYGGRIIPRYPDGNLRYYGGHTRVLSVPRSLSFTELARKLTEMCGMAVSFRCQLPTEDLDALVTVTSDEDLTNLIEEYDHCASKLPSKIRAFLSPVKSAHLPSTVLTVTPACPLCLERSAERICNKGYYAHRNRTTHNNHFYVIHSGNHSQ